MPKNLTFAIPFPESAINASFLQAFARISSYMKTRNVDTIIVETGTEDAARRKAKIIELLDVIDGVIIPGNPFSIDPRIYGESPLKPHRIDPNPNNFKFLSMLIDKARSRGMPILGICMGSWAINVAGSGNLMQEIKTDEHHIRHDKDPRKGDVIHPVAIIEGTMLSEIIQRKTIRVNSWHDQAIGKLGHDLIVSAIAPDGTAEGIEGVHEPFLLGIQFHPEYLKPKRSVSFYSADEYLSDEEINDQLKIFSTMVQVARQYSAKKRLHGSSGFFNKQLNEIEKQERLSVYRERTEDLLEKHPREFSLSDDNFQPTELQASLLKGFG